MSMETVNREKITEKKNSTKVTCKGLVFIIHIYFVQEEEEEEKYKEKDEEITIILTQSTQSKVLHRS